MKKLVQILVLAAAVAASGETLLRIGGGVEETTELSTNGLPAVVSTPLFERMLADGWAPYRPAPRPADTWCTTSIRTLSFTNGVWREGWEEASIPVALDRTRLVEAVLALPDGTNLLSAAIASEPVATWFAASPTYIRGSQGAQAVSAALGLTTNDLEALVLSCLSAP